MSERISAALGLHDLRVNLGHSYPKTGDITAWRVREALQESRWRKSDAARVQAVVRKYHNTAGSYPRRSISFLDTVMSFAPFPERVKATAIGRSIRSVQCLRRNTALRGYIPDSKTISAALNGTLRYSELPWKQALRRLGIPFSPLPSQRLPKAERNRQIRKLAATRGIAVKLDKFQW